MTTTRPHDSGPHEPRAAISSDAADWIRNFTKYLELHFLDVGHTLPAPPSHSDLKAATARAILATFMDSGMEVETALDLIGQAAAERGPAAVWNESSNQRRFALIDKEIQGTLTPAERVELAGLTRALRDHVESEANLPMEGARALHRKLLQLEPMGESE